MQSLRLRADPDCVEPDAASTSMSNGEVQDPLLLGVKVSSDGILAGSDSSPSGTRSEPA